jgi:hypothetical protein
VRCLLRFVVLGGTALAVLHFLTPPRVYSNDYRLIAPALMLAGLALLAALRPRDMAYCMFPMIGILAFALPLVRDGRMSDRAVSCANHFGQWSKLLGDRIYKARVGESLPSTMEFDEVLAQLWPDRDRRSFYCPGRVSSSERTGYVYVGSGLPVDVARRERALVAFCAAGCHPPPWDHEHALIGDSRECLSGPALANEIRRALELARSGRIPYGPDAVAALERELEARR